MTMDISNFITIEKEELQIKQKNYFYKVLEELILRADLLCYTYNVKQYNDIPMLIIVFFTFQYTLL
jgi:hypothetical protein